MQRRDLSTTSSYVCFEKVRRTTPPAGQTRRRVAVACTLGFGLLALVASAVLAGVVLVPALLILLPWLAPLALVAVLSAALTICAFLYTVLTTAAAPTKPCSPARADDTRRENPEDNTPTAAYQRAGLFAPWQRKPHSAPTATTAEYVALVDQFVDNCLQQYENSDDVCLALDRQLFAPLLQWKHTHPVGTLTYPAHSAASDKPRCVILRTVVNFIERDAETHQVETDDSKQNNFCAALEEQMQSAKTAYLAAQQQHLAPGG